ncbi:hypothetical protein K469DRAFT_175532 [Zopfia rhizophila CBS 207.26]|uniref:Uncharacterized protein n=1 Tax=Zopfia rhizophila CBS 207.26 TaxID=1314779 RepID=A0A6A6E4X0_9PEZI|nr:hypothetical protein K469DRAFT_175532 [Zopfia rhizophila CBS 207.26]
MIARLRSIHRSPNIEGKAGTSETIFGRIGDAIIPAGSNENGARRTCGKIRLVPFFARSDRRGKVALRKRSIAQAGKEAEAIVR